METWECDVGKPDLIKLQETKKLWQVFRDIDKRTLLEASEFAKSLIGINKWSDVIPDFKWKNIEKLTTESDQEK